VGIPYAATVMNVVVIAAALSSANTNLYTSTRMLYSLARGNYAPAALGRLSPHGVPHRALATCCLGMVVAILLAIYAPKRAFLVLYGSAVAGMYFVWIIILLAHLQFRRSIGPKVDDLPLRLRLFPISSAVGIAALIALGFSTFYVDGLQYSLPTLAVLLAGMTAVYTMVRRRMKSEPSLQLETAPESSPAEP
jgi:amino acid transporter, AAT family